MECGQCMWDLTCCTMTLLSMNFLMFPLTYQKYTGSPQKLSRVKTHSQDQYLASLGVLFSANTFCASNNAQNWMAKVLQRLLSRNQTPLSLHQTRHWFPWSGSLHLLSTLRQVSIGDHVGQSNWQDRQLKKHWPTASSVMQQVKTLLVAPESHFRVPIWVPLFCLRCPASFLTHLEWQWKVTHVPGPCH